MSRWLLVSLQAILIIGVTMLPMTGLLEGVFNNVVPDRQDAFAGPLAQDDNDEDNDDGDNDDNDEDNDDEDNEDNEDNSDDNGNDNDVPTNTPIPTETPIPPVNTLAPTLTPTITLTPTPLPVCTPRPSVGVTVAPIGGGSLQVTLTANSVNNRLQQLRFQASTNALIDVRDRQGAQGPFTVDLPDHPQQLSFVVRRANPGAAVTVPLGAVDGCGEWPTLVGQGAGAS